MSGTRPAEILRRLDHSEPAGDAALLDRFARARDHVAFAELVRRHGPVVLGVCRRVTRNLADAEDAFQATFLVLAKKAGGVGNPELLGNWLYGVAVRVAGKARRTAARRRAWEVQVTAMPDPATPAPDPADDLGPVLHEELAALPPWYREPIVLCDLRGVSRPEAAKALGVPEGTLSSRLANGRRKLADRLTRRGVALAVTAVPVALGDARSAVPDDLVTKTCGLVADWAAGGPVAGSVARLASGGSTVRNTLLFGVMTMAAAAGVGYAAFPGADPATARPATTPAGRGGRPAAGQEAGPETRPEAGRQRPVILHPATGHGDRLAGGERHRNRLVAGRQGACRARPPEGSGAEVATRPRVDGGAGYRGRVRRAAQLPVDLPAEPRPARRVHPRRQAGRHRPARVRASYSRSAPPEAGLP